MPYGITQCYLSPGSGVNPAFAPLPKQVLGPVYHLWTVPARNWSRVSVGVMQQAVCQ